MFLKRSTRKKDGKEHRSWSVVESRRVGRGVVQRHVLYLGEINDSQRAAWQKAVEVCDDASGQHRQCALFPHDRPPPLSATPAVQVRLDQLQLVRPRSWGACWLGDQLWRELQLDAFFAARLGCSREGTDWEKVLRLLSPGSEWRLHRHWFHTTACADERLAQDDTLYRGLDGLLAHKEALFTHLRARWRDLFGAKFDVLLYDLTSTYFECEQAGPAPHCAAREAHGGQGSALFGYSRDKRSDGVQVIVALVVTPGGLPLAYEMFPGNTAAPATGPAAPWPRW